MFHAAVNDESHDLLPLLWTFPSVLVDMYCYMLYIVPVNTSPCIVDVQQVTTN